jgi:hypothetical protein
MKLDNLNNAEDLLMLLSQVDDYHNPFSLIGLNINEVLVEQWLDQLDQRGLLDVASNKPPLVRLNEVGRETAFRLSLSMLPDLTDEQFHDCVIALARRRETKVQIKLANELRIPPANGATQTLPSS